MPVRSEERDVAFEKIEAAYHLFYHELRLSGNLPYRSTASGMWAVSDARQVYRAFCHFGLGRYNHMADLGSGDGVAALIGSLFTQVTGYETDEILYKKSLEIRDALELIDARFMRRDYLWADLSPYDMLYLYPDKPFYALEEKLRPLWRGHILVNGPHLRPRYLNKIAEFSSALARFVLYDSQ